jgi:hypothetical protein
MKKLLVFSMLLSLAVPFTGCTIPSKEIKTGSQKDNAVVFSEVKKESPIPIGYADVILKTSIKTHEEGFYWFEPKKSIHGKPGYPFLINIDGQIVTWKVDGKKEDIPSFDEQGNKNYEGGVGVRYALERKIRLPGGSHSIIFKLPAEKLATKMEIVLKADRSHVLEFKAFYKHHKKHATTFLCTIAGYDVFLDGKLMAVWNRKT